MEYEDIKHLTLQARKQIAKQIIFYVVRNKTYSRKYKAPFQPNTEKQLHIKNKFRQAVQAWHQLTEQQKKYYNDKVKKLNLKMEGFNYFIRLYMLNKL